MNHHNNQLTVMVTGAGGFLGNELVNNLLQENNIKVIAVTSKPELIKDKYSSFNLITLNTNEWEKSLSEKIDIIVNCAFPRTSIPSELVKGILFAEKLVKYSNELNIGSIINISSQSVYTQKEKARTDENALISPETLYGMAKYACERLVESLCKENQINFSNIRLASLTGLDFNVRMNNKFVKAVINKEKITIHGGMQKVSYLEVRDAAEALKIMALSDPTNWESAYNLGNNEAITLLELISILKKEARKNNIQDINVEIIDKEVSFSNLLDSSLFYSTFNWKPRFNKQKMIAELFERQMNF